MDKKESKIHFNLPKYWKIIMNDKLWFCVYPIIGICIGLVVAFSIPKFYKSSVELAPESSSNSMLSSISDIASMVGLYNDANPTNDAIYPEIYPDMMSSNEFIVSLFDVPVRTIDGKINTTYYKYLRLFQKAPWWQKPGIWLREAFQSNEDNLKGKDEKVNPRRLTRDEDAIATSIRKSMNCDVDKKTNVISIEVKAQDPYIAAQMADTVKTRLQAFITRYRTNKSRRDLKYIEKLHAEAKADYTKARQRYAAFSDANMDAELQSVASKQEDMENEMQLKYNIYTQVSQQLQVAKAKLQESTPAFTVIQQASVPVEASNMRKIYILFMFMFLGALTRMVVLAIQHRKDIFSFNG